MSKIYRLSLLLLFPLFACQSSDHSTAEDTTELRKEQLLYIASRGHGFDIYSYDLATETEKPFTDAPGWEWSPQYLPGEDIVVYNSQDTTGTFLLLAAGLLGESAAFTLPDLPDVKVSPDGQWIVFSRQIGEVSQLKLAPRENIADSLLITTEEAYHGRAKWSRESDQLAYISDQTGTNEVFRYHLARQETQQLTDNGLREKYLSWSPDGKYLATSIRTDSTENDMAIIDLSDLSLQKITDTSISESELAWSPSGRYLAYHAKVKEMDDIFLLDLETRDIKKVTLGNGYHGEPEWIMVE